MRIATLPIIALLTTPVGSQVPVPEPTVAPVPPRIRTAIERELSLIDSAKEDWSLRKNAADTLVALAGNRAKSEFVLRLVGSRYVRSKNLDEAQLLLSVIGRVPVKAREASCELTIADWIDEEARLCKKSERHIPSVVALQRLDMLLAYCSRQRAYDLRNQIQREPWHAGIVRLFGGRRPKGREFSALAVDYRDLSHTCPLMTAWDQIAEIRPVPRVDSDPEALNAFLTGPPRDKYDSPMRASILGLIGSRADVAGFLPMLCAAFEHQDYPRLWKHDARGREARLPAAAADALVHLAAARAILFAASAASAKQRAGLEVRYRAALSYLGRHGTPAERRAAAAMLKVGGKKR